jgi:histidine ammonia-lyase
MSSRCRPRHVPLRVLSDAGDFRARIARGADFLDRLLREDGVIYGVTTGYGDSCTVSIPPALVAELPHHLYTYHGCGLGRFLDAEETRAVLVARLASLSQGMSGVSLALLAAGTRCCVHDVLPLIPAEGSVGASGDLTPLSYVAAVLCGEREVWHEGAAAGSRGAGRDRHAAAALRPKEGLAIMNGTAVMTALACLAWRRADYLSRLATRLTAFNVLASAAMPTISTSAVRGQAASRASSAWPRRLRADLHGDRPARNEQRLQDRYSLRCAPHVIGVLEDALPWLRQLIENELNSANDNPLIDPEREQVLHGGHFYGGHIAFAMDSLKNGRGQRRRPAGPPAGAVGRRPLQPRPAGQPVGAHRAARGDQPWPEGPADQRVGLDGGSAQADDAGVGVLALHRMPQPGQGQHGHHRRARLPARDRADRTGGGRMLMPRARAWPCASRTACVQLGDGAAAMYADLEARIALVEEDRALDGDLRGCWPTSATRRWRLYVG